MFSTQKHWEYHQVIDHETLDKIAEKATELKFLKGLVLTQSNLPASPIVGDTYLVMSQGSFYTWTGSRWQVIGGAATDDVLANRPAPSQAGALFIATDTQEIYLDTGSSWLRVGGNGTSSNVGDTIVRRDSSGNFSAGTITATLDGKASSASSADSVPWNGVTSKPSTFPPSAHTHASSDITDATDNNTASTIVKRDSSGNFSAGTITATLNGNASTATNASNSDMVDNEHSSAFTHARNGGSNIWVQSTAPTALAVGDIWINTSV